jgi:hypothetical protein
MDLHVECLPDEALLKKLGFTRKQITHHGGKSRVFAELSKKNDQFAMVDEDPGKASPPYHRKLILKKEKYGISYFRDAKRNNTVLILKEKLEDWILDISKKDKIDVADFGLPARPNDLHDIINYKLSAFEKLLDKLKQNKNKPLQQLKQWLEEGA